MKKILKRLGFALFFISILMTKVEVSAHSEESFSKTRNQYKLTRVSGVNRYQTNKLTINDLYPSDKREQVIITSGLSFPDALSSYNISVAENSPILLTMGIELESQIMESIKQLQASKILIIGGTEHISQNIEDTLKDQAYKVSRIAGDNRYHTNRITLERTKDFFDKNHRAVVSGEKYPDALSAAPLLRENNWALSLADTPEDLIDDYKYTIIGNTQAKNHKNVINTLIGEDRYQTNELINNELKNKDHTIFVSGHSYADALSALNYLKFDNNQIILVNNSLDLNLLDKDIRKNMTLLGGESTLSLIKDQFKKGYALTFDDINIRNWYDALDLLDKYNTKATFYISHNFLIEDYEWEMIKEIEKRGHEIASHSYNHKDAQAYVIDHSVEEYIKNEIIPSLKLFEENDIVINSFSYPGGAYNIELNTELNKIFPILRGTTYSSKDRPLKNTGLAYVNENSRGNFVSAIGLDIVYNNSLKDVQEGLDRANNNNEVILFYSHDISYPDKESDNYSIEIQHLANILEYAQSLGLKSYTVSELNMALDN